MKDKFLKEKKMKNKFLAVSMASLILMSSFPVTSPVYALANEALDGVTQATENDSNILKELTKDANAEQLVIRDGSFTYKLKVFVNKNANFVEGIVDETDTVNGVYGNIAMIWGQFKGENKGLKKYGGKTFGEIKTMQTPDDIIVMGGRDDIPKKVHKKILEFIAREDAKEGKAEREKKNELARSLYKYRYRYVYKNTQIWDATTLTEFLESYNKAREVLEKSNPSDKEISDRISDLEKKYRAIKAAPFSDAKFKELVRQAEEKIKNKDSYTLSTMAELQRVLAEVRNDFDAGKIKNLLEMNKAEEKLQKALDQLVTKEESKKRFTINGEVLQYGNENEKSMANQFMDPSVLLIEEDNAKIYEVTFKKGTFQGITAEVEGIKYDRENGSWQDASLVNTVNDTKTFRLVMPKSDIEKIHIKTLAHMGGPELAEQDAVLKLNLSTKRPEGSQLEEGNKKELKEFLDSIQELNKDVNDGLYKEPKSTEFKNKYIEATKLLEENQVTDDAIEAMIRSIRIIKQDLVLKALDDFAQKLGTAEGITTDKSSKEKYTEKSLAKLQEAVDAGNAVWRNRFDQPKEEIARLIDLLDTAMTGLREKGQEEEEDNSTEGKVFTAPVTLMHASNPTQKSMANSAIVSPAKISYIGDKVKIELTFKGLTIGANKGHLTNLFYFENNIPSKDGGNPIAAKIEKNFKDQGMDGQEKEFPQVFSFTIDRNLFEKSDFLWCRVWVDVMDGFMGGTPGAGAQEAKIVIDKTQLEKVVLNKEALTNEITTAKAIEQGKKTDEAFNTLKAAITSAEKVLGEAIEQTQLDEAVKTLKAAVKAFNESADKEVTPQPAPIPQPEPRPNPNPSPQEKPEVDPGKKPEKRPEVSPEKQTNTKPEPYFPNFSYHRRNSSSSRTNEGKVYVGSPKATKDLVRKEEVKKAEVKAPEGKESQSNTIPKNFEDTKGHWANKAIDYVVNKGYFSGISEKEFGPNKAITRGQFVTVLGRILNINVDDFKANKFKDVDSSQYYAAYVSWAESVGITKGRGNGNFDPNKEITREEMAVMMEKFLNVAGKNLGEVENTKKFKDENKIQSWAQDSVKKMTRLGLINGMEDGSFSPKSSFTRGQVAQILYNMDNK